ncbi:MAG TPA: hypothetical protein ENH94_07430 [Phycisphaerales bacterium]|nr:hypothetical protein [Phycisphaerales bacterium]
MDTKFFDSLYEGDSANGIKLGMGITGGDFWPRISGCRNLYRGEDLPLIDWSKLINVSTSDPGSIISGQEHQPGEIYFYAIRLANFCGYEEHTFGAVVKVVFDDNGDLVVESGCNAIFEIKGRQVSGSVCRLTWYYAPINQSEEVAQFNVYSDGGAGEIDYDNIISTVAYSGPRYYSFDSEVLAKGVYRYCIRTVSVSGKENGDLGFVQVGISDEKPAAVESVRIESNL